MSNSGFARRQRGVGRLGEVDVVGSPVARPRHPAAAAGRPRARSRPRESWKKSTPSSITSGRCGIDLLPVLAARARRPAPSPGGSCGPCRWCGCRSRSPCVVDVVFLLVRSRGAITFADSPPARPPAGSAPRRCRLPMPSQEVRAAARAADRQRRTARPSPRRRARASRSRARGGRAGTARLVLRPPRRVEQRAVVGRPGDRAPSSRQPSEQLPSPLRRSFTYRVYWRKPVVSSV